MAVKMDAAIGIKPISRDGTRRFMRSAIEYALRNGRGRITMVHKGNIMKATEGGFRKWGYELASEEFGGKVVAASKIADHENICHVMLFLIQTVRPVSTCYSS